jgi:hypothetical protein
MGIDSSIAMGYRSPDIQNPLNAMSQVLQAQGLQNQNALATYGLNRAQRQDAETNRLSQLLSSGVDLSTPEGQAQAYQVAPTVAGSYIKNQLDTLKTRSDIGKNDADAKAKTLDTAAKRVDLMGQAFAGVRQNPTLDNANGALDLLGAHGVLPPDQVQQFKATLAQDPTQVAAFADHAFRTALGAKDQLAKIQTNNTGASTVTQSIDPITGKVLNSTSMANTVSPDAALSAATSRSNNAANIAKDLQVAGMAPGGGIDDNAERTAQAIASGQLPAPTGMALLNPRNQRILGRVMEINPKYDFTDVTAKKKAASDFTSGTLGNSLRSFAVAGQHLDQLGQLADAMNNGNIQLVNQLGNTVAAQTGSAAPTNFNAAKDIVSKEVMKAIVAGGGGVAEREELNRTMSSANSPAQLKGVITQYRNLMAAQHDALLQQRRAAGLSDSTLPSYSTPAGGDGTAGAAAGGLPPMSAIDAELARRVGK